MRLLLDTHIFVWAVTGNPKLPERAAELLTDPNNSRTVSVASTWEMSIKASMSKWEHAAQLLDDVEAAAADIDASILSIDLAATIAAGRLDWSHRDPFDRMLAAQTQLGDYSLLTVDHAFGTAGVQLALDG